MIALSYALRSKPSWWTEIKDPAIRSKWKAEALEHEIQGDKLKEAEIEWVLDELEDYVKMRDEATGIQVSYLPKRPWFEIQRRFYHRNNSHHATSAFGNRMN